MFNQLLTNILLILLIIEKKNVSIEAFTCTSPSWSWTTTQTTRTSSYLVTTTTKITTARRSWFFNPLFLSSSSSSTNNDNTRRKKNSNQNQKQKRKRRFHQDAHPSLSSSSSSSLSKFNNNNNNEENDDGGFFFNNDNSRQRNDYGQQKQNHQLQNPQRKNSSRGRRQQGDNNNSMDNNQQRRNRRQQQSTLSSLPVKRPTGSMMKQKGKSIEELESIMMTRWGTDTKKWSSNPEDENDDDDDYDEFFDNDDYDDNDYDNVFENYRSSSKNSVPTKKKQQQQQSIKNMKVNNVVRSKPVFDPWQKEEYKKRKQQNKQQKEQEQLFQDDDDDDDYDEDRFFGGTTTSNNNIDNNIVILDRVKRNQERLRQKRGRTGTTNNNKNNNNNNNEKDIISDYDYHEDFFDDDDDDGYGNDTPSNDNDYDFNNLIQSKPVGGIGSLSSSSSRTQKTDTSNGKSIVGGGGFFFNNNVDISTTATTKGETQEKNNDATTTTNQQKNKNKKSKSRYQPMLDENDNVMYLTTDQAMKNFELSTATTAAGAAASGEEIIRSSSNDAYGIIDDEYDDYDIFVDDNDNEYDDDDDYDTSSSTSSSLGEKKSWKDIGITSKILLDNLLNMNCNHPLSVQEKSCMSILSNKDAKDKEDESNDVVIDTYTGSGKTLAFMVPTIQKILLKSEENNNNNNSIQTIVVTPGRELASQIISVTRSLLVGTGLSCQLAIGGMTLTRTVEQIRKKKPSIIIGTPGRIAELIIGSSDSSSSGGGSNKGKILKRTNTVNTLILDEFDALLGYDKINSDPTYAIIHTLQQKTNNKNKSLQLIMASATASDMLSLNSGSPTSTTTTNSQSSNTAEVEYDDEGDIIPLTTSNDRNDNSINMKKLLKPNYVHIVADDHDQLITSAAEETTSTRVSRTVIHGVVHVEHQRKTLETLRKILHTDPLPQQVLIFVENSHKVEIMVEKLADMGIIAAPLHGGRGSEKIDRAEVSKALREGYVGIVVATELAARGLDAPLLTHVFNVDLPTDSSHYAHRAGRCGRGGRPGVVINFTRNPKERNVPKRFAADLGIVMHRVEPIGGKLCIIEEK